MTRQELYINLMDKTTPSQNATDRLKTLTKVSVKRPKRMKRILPLVAVILILTVVLTITTTAKYSFSSIFGGIFSGEAKTEVVVPEDTEIYSGSDVLDFKCLGITGGTDYDCCIAYEITRRDKKPLITSTKKNEPRFDNVSVYLSDKNVDLSYSMSEYLYFKDNNTIIFYESLYRLDEELNGSEYIGVYNGLKFNGIKEYKECYIKDQDELSKLKGKYTLAPDEKLVAVYNKETDSYQIAVEGEFICDNDMWAEFTFDYKPSYMQGAVKSESLNIKSATATEFGITLVGECGEESFDENFLSQGIANTSDGRVIPLQEYSSSFVGKCKDKKGQFVVSLYYKDDEKDKMQIINYRDIKSVIINGITIIFKG